eukprot:334097_1
MPKENIHVCIRFRPSNKREKKEQREQKTQDKPPIFQNDDKRGIGALEICSIKSTQPHNFTFDRISDANESQEDVFYHVAEHVCEDVLDGYNGCIFAYGQTGSGKTYTMFGPEDDHAHPKKMGIIPRSISFIFTEIEEDEDITEARIKVSFVEIYKEKLRDLLNPSSRKPLKIKLQQNGETRIANVTETHVTTLLDVLQLIEVANSYRTKAITSMNHSSSRSHMLMTLTVALRMEDRSISVGKLNFCDLAGSEKVRKTNATGERLKEAMKINLGLTILGQVISALSQNKKHVPFRDSKLTHVLKDSLGGNCKTTLIVNCTKHMFNRDETINSLRFGSRCKMISNNVKVNRIYSNAELMNLVERLRRENAKLHELLRNKGFAEDIIASPKGNKLFDKKKKKKKNDNYDKYNTNQHHKLMQENQTLKQHINKMDGKYHYQQQQYNQVQEKLQSVSDVLQAKEKQCNTLSAHNKQQQKDIQRIRTMNENLTLSLKSAQNQIDEYKMEIGDITKDRHYKTTKLSKQLTRFRELHKDAKDETTELMDEVLKLKQSLDKSEAIMDAQNHQLSQKRKDVDALRKDLMERDRKVSTIFNEKASLQTDLAELKAIISQNKSESTEKDDEIEQLKEEMEKRTQELTQLNHELTQKLEQREMVQHAYSIRSMEPLEALVEELNSNKSPVPVVSPMASPMAGKANTAMLNAGILSAGGLHHPKIVSAFQPSQEAFSPELLIQSASIHGTEDVIQAEQSLLAQYDYLQKMDTARLVERRSTGRFSKRRESKLAGKKQKKIVDIGAELKEQKKNMKKELEDKKKTLEAMRKIEAPEDNEKRLQVLLKVATLEDDIVQLKRRIKNVEKQISKQKDGKNKDESDNVAISKVTTMEALNYIDAALTLSAMRNDDSDDDELRFLV